MNRRVAISIGAALLCASVARPAGAAERWRIGLTASDAPIEALMVPAASESAPTVLLIAGLQGRDRTVDEARQEVEQFEKVPVNGRAFRLVAIPLANPDARPLQFPPQGTAYRDNAEAHVLWRWIGIHAPDLVVVVGNEGSSLVTALSQEIVAFVGRIPCRSVPAAAGEDIVAGIGQAKDGKPDSFRRAVRDEYLGRRVDAHAVQALVSQGDRFP